MSAADAAGAARIRGAGASFKPYVVRDSGATIAQVFARVNDQIDKGYGCDFSFGGAAKIVAASAFDYELLLRELTAIPNLEFVTHRDLLREPCPPDRIRVGIRHDVDMDIVAALQQARLEHAHGVASNWVVLHTAPYYGELRDGEFLRHECMIHVYRRLQDLGHEVSLHTDPLLLYQIHGIDGAQAVVAEIEWLRAHGIRLYGTTAHNHRPVYGAENYEVFKGYARPADRRSGVPLPDWVEHGGRHAPLHVLDERSLGLEYEGNEVFWQQHTPLEYGAIRMTQRWNWHAHRRRLEQDPGTVEEDFIDQARLVEAIRALPGGRYLVLVVHPVYYGGRAGPDRAPLLRSDRVVAAPNPRLGWISYEPTVRQCWSGPRDAAQEGQVVHAPNELGMLDRPLPAADETAAAALRILLLGADNVDGLPVAVPVQLHSILADLVEKYAGSRPQIVKLAYPGMGIDRLWSWFETVRDRLRPTVVILGIGDQALRHNWSRAWARATGISAHYPAGGYLKWDPAAARVVAVERAPAWSLHRRDPQADTVDPASGANLVTALGDDVVPTLEGLDGCDYLARLYGALCAAVADTGARTLLLLEANGELAARDAQDGNLGRCARHADRARERIAGIAATLGVPLADPYALFAALPPRLPACHRRDGRWNATGHRLAAHALFETLRSEGLLPA